MRTSLVLPLLGLAALGSAQNHDLYPKEHIPQFVITKLDVTSFRSSIGPRRQKGKTTFKDYGFYPVKVTEHEAAMELKDGTWRFTVEVLKRTDAGILICLSETAQNGGTYKASGPLFLVRSNNAGMLIADKKRVETADCPEFAR